MKEKLILYINIKIAISLNRLLKSGNMTQQFNNSKEEMINSYNQIALEAGIRKATVSDTFNAKSKSGPNSTTVILIIEAMGYSLLDFAKIYDSVNDTEIKNF
ncbi:hypothetical protein HSX10_06485 [Winogradskyella undariae]|uniref:hypothetical protein n=1 Tax=Winogradskyella undariae TaxID=1285465 RepID=UPI00156B4D46|nr:hypothetical protein [Winogradskyella undariae]NRR91208.1 hypothetical protein [Winogradskyella undariae]